MADNYACICRKSPVVNDKSSWYAESYTRDGLNSQAPEVHEPNDVDETDNDDNLGPEV